MKVFYWPEENGTRQDMDIDNLEELQAWLLGVEAPKDPEVSFVLEASAVPDGLVFTWVEVADIDG